MFDGIKARLAAANLGVRLAAVGIKGGPRGIVSALNQLMNKRWGEPPKRGGKEWLELYGKSPRLSPVHKIAQDVGAAPWGLYSMQGKNKVEIQEHPLSKLLKKPNPKMTSRMLFTLTEIYLQLRGEAGWLIERNGLRLPAELWPIPPHWVEELPRVDRPVYIVNLYGRAVPVAATDMVWFWEPDPVDPYSRGLGRAQAVADEIETDEYMAKYSKRFFFNDAKPNIVFQMPGASQDVIDRFMESWTQKYSGFNNAHKPAAVSWDLKVTELNKAQKDLEYTEGRRLIRNITNEHWNMPPEILGIIENSNRATIDAADYLYAKNVLRPRLLGIQDRIQEDLVPQFDSRLLFEFDNPIPEDREFQLKAANEALDRGGIDVDEYRQRALLLDPIPNNGGKVFYVPLRVIARTPAEAMDFGYSGSPASGGSPPESEADKGKAKGVKANGLNGEQKKALWFAFDKAAIKNEISCRRTVVKFFQRQQDEASRKLEELLGDKSYLSGAFKEIEEDLVERMLRWHDEQVKMVNVMRPYWLASAEEGFTIANQTFRFGVSFDLVRAEMMRWIANQGAKKVRGITETTKEQLSETLAEGIEAGESIPKLRDRVGAVFEEAKTSRATAIARTETHNTVSAGTFETYKAAEVSRKEWLATQDDRTRDEHSIMDGESQGIDETFSNGLMYPGADGPPEEVINCRCALLPVIE